MKEIQLYSSGTISDMAWSNRNNKGSATKTDFKMDTEADCISDEGFQLPGIYQHRCCTDSIVDLSWHPICHWEGIGSKRRSGHCDVNSTLCKRDKVVMILAGSINVPKSFWQCERQQSMSIWQRERQQRSIQKNKRQVLKTPAKQRGGKSPLKSWLTGGETVLTNGKRINNQRPLWSMGRPWAGKWRHGLWERLEISSHVQ